jgi:hypothetical protein
LRRFFVLLMVIVGRPAMITLSCFLLLYHKVSRH